MDGPSPAAHRLAAFITSANALSSNARHRVIFLTGAGCSTASGIPDYRSPTGLYAKGHRPMTIQAFLKPGGAQRYFARSFLGFPNVRRAQPNPAHLSIAALISSEQIHCVITQNVDGLHVLAASADPMEGLNSVTELHGSLHRVKCLQCGSVTSRTVLQERLENANRELLNSTLFLSQSRHPTDGSGDGETTGRRPDGDQDVAEDYVRRFQTVPCAQCVGGMLMPDVVFFGDAVKPAVVEQTRELVSQCAALVCAGTSLQVYSALRFVHVAHRASVPVAIINDGPTRGDDIAALRVSGAVEQILPEVQQLLSHG